MTKKQTLILLNNLGAESVDFFASGISFKAKTSILWKSKNGINYIIYCADNNTYAER